MSNLPSVKTSRCTVPTSEWKQLCSSFKAASDDVFCYCCSLIVTVCLIDPSCLFAFKFAACRLIALRFVMENCLEDYI